jgi:tetratricopeptide (TPR) repeat protein
VVLPNGGPIDGAIQVRLENIRGTKSTAFTDNQGNFNFFSLAPGLYEVVVEGDNRRDGANVSVEVFPNLPSIVTIIVREKVPQPTKETTAVSAGELNQNVPAAARKEFERGSAASKEGKTEQAITHYRKAIEIYPNFLMARNDLGAQLMTLDKLDEAAEQLRIAISIEPKAFNPRLNMGMVLVKQHNFVEAADELRIALSLDSTSASVHFYLGLAVEGILDSDNADKESSAHAEKEFKTAYNIGGAEYAIALYHLGDLYLKRGERDAALKAFEKYLSEAPNATNAAQVRQMIAMLK